MTRSERLAELVARHGEDPDSYDEECEEDLRPFLSGAEECGRFLCVTAHGERLFFYPRFDDTASAFARATRDVNDSLYSETPVAVYDLDDGTEFLPQWQALPWKADGA